MSATLSLAARWQRYRYLASVELWLDALPGRRRRAVLRELKANLSEAAADVGMAAAIADLGRPRALARQFVDAEPGPRPRWTHGAVAAGLVFGAWLYATLFYTIGMIDALASTGTVVPAHGSFLGTQVQAVSNETEISGGFTGFPWLPLAVMLVAFLVVGRVWNLRPHRAAAEVSAP